MKLRILSIGLLLALSAAVPKVQAQVSVDPVLTGAIVAQTSALSKVYDERSKRHKAIIAAEAAVTTALSKIHEVEEKTLDYLSNAQGAVQNLYQGEKIGELSASIGKRAAELTRVAKQHLPAAVATGLIEEESKDLWNESAALIPFLYQLIKTGTYNRRNDDGSVDRKKVNLLNAYERYYILNEVVSRLENIDTDLMCLTWEVETFSLSRIFEVITPEAWCNYMYGLDLAKDVIAEFEDL